MYCFRRCSSFFRINCIFSSCFLKISLKGEVGVGKAHYYFRKEKDFLDVGGWRQHIYYMN